MLHCCSVTIVPFKKQAILKWKTTPSEGDPTLPVNEHSSTTSVVLNETGLCEDEKPTKHTDSSNDILEELSNDSKTDTLSDFTIPDQEEGEDNSGVNQEERSEDLARTHEAISKLICDSVTGSDANAVVTEKSSPNINMSTIQPQTDIITNSSPPGSPEPLTMDESAMSSHDASEIIRTEKNNPDRPSEVKTNSGTETPQQGKRKKVTTNLFLYIF